MVQKSPVFVRDATGLIRSFGFFDLIFLSLAGVNFLGALVSTLLYAPFYFPAANMPIVFAVGTLPAFAMAAVYGILSRAMPRSGGDYVWSTRIMGPLYGIVQWVLLFFTLVILIAEFIVIFPITVFLPQLLFSFGVTTNNPAIIAAASTVTQPIIGLTLNMIYLGIGIIIAFCSTKIFVRVQRLVWILYLAIAVILVVTLLSLNPSSTASLFDHAMQVAGSNATYSSVIQTASSGGLTQGFNTSNTLLAILPWGFFTFTGFEYSTYAAGEVKNAKTMITKALVGAVVLMATLLVITTMVSYSGIGSDFLNSASYIVATNPSYLPTPPTITLIASLISPFLSLLIGVGIIVSILIGISGMILIQSRMIFAASFDRILPQKLADVNERFHSPHWAVLFVGACYAILLPLFWLTSYTAALLNLSLMVPIALALPFVATLVFPFKKPQLFAQTLGGKNEALKLVLLSVVCLVTFVIYTLCLIVPFNSGIYLGTSLSLAVEVVAAFVLVGIGLYVVANYRLRRAGIDLRRVYDEIPPE